MTTRQVSFIGFILVVTLGCFYLSFWQWQRLDWKSQLLKELQLAWSLPLEEYKPSLQPLAFVKVEGEIQNVWRQLVTLDKVRGYRLFGLLISSKGEKVAVDLGFVPDQQWDQWQKREPWYLQSIGLLRPAQQSSIFTPQPDEQERLLFSRDGMLVGATFSDFVELLAPAEKDRGSLNTKRRSYQEVIGGIPNNHLQYALTWLALGIVGVFCMIIWLRNLRG